MSGYVIRGSRSPVSVSSMFGWILPSRTSAEESRGMKVICPGRGKFATTNLIIERPELMTLSPFNIHSENDELCNALQKFWNIESLGVREKPPVSQSNGEEFLESIHFDENEGIRSAIEGRSCSCFKRVRIVCYMIETAALAKNKM